MAPYLIRYTDTAVKSLKKLDMGQRNRILRQIELLAQAPHNKSNVKRLAGADTTYRLRVGNYRVLYDLDDEIRIVDVIDVRHRREAYRR